VSIGENLSEKFPVQNGPKQGETLSLYLFNLPLEYAIRKVQENQEKLKLNGTLQILLYADNGYIVGENIGTIKKKQNFY
jgi:hypothetical protein